MKYHEGFIVKKNIRVQVQAFLDDFNAGMMKCQDAFIKVGQTARKFGEIMRKAESQRKKDVKRQRWAKQQNR